MNGFSSVEHTGSESDKCDKNTHCGEGYDGMIVEILAHQSFGWHDRNTQGGDIQVSAPQLRVADC